MSLDILIDLDSITADLLTPWLERYNQDYGPDGQIVQGFELGIEHITHWHLHKVVHPECNYRVYDYLDGDLFDSLKPLPGAVESIRALRNMGHKIFFVSSPSADPQTSAVKQSWIKEYFPEVNRRNVFLCHEKQMIKGDILIDDSPDNLEKYKKAWPAATTITIHYPFNDKVDVNFRAFSYKDTETAWKSIVKYIG